MWFENYELFRITCFDTQRSFLSTLQTVIQTWKSSTKPVTCFLWQNMLHARSVVIVTNYCQVFMHYWADTS